MATIAGARLPYSVSSVSQVGAPIAQRFPVPALAWGNMFVKEFDPPLWDRPRITNALSGALTVEGTHTEPTIGQIWPR